MLQIAEIMSVFMVLVNYNNPAYCANAMKINLIDTNICIYYILCQSRLIHLFIYVFVGAAKGLK